MASKGAIWGKHEVIAHILYGERIPVAPWAGYMLSIAIFGVALAVRFIILPVEGGAAFVTFYSAVFFSALLFGARAGLLTLALSATAAEYIFRPPFRSFALNVSEVSPLVIFILSGGAICFLIHQMQHRAVELRKYKGIVESSSDAIISKTPGGIITSWNKGAERIYGYTADEVMGKFITILAQPSSHPEIHELLEKIRKGIAVANYDVERIRKDGVPIQVALNLSPIRDATGNIVGISTIARDITESKRAEDALREKEERLALATVNNGVGVWDWNLQTQEMIWDDSMYALYHIRREDFSGTEEAWRTALHPDDLARGDKEVEDAISGKKPFETEFRVLWPNGEVRYIKAVAKVFRDNQGVPLRMLGINMDVSDRRKAEMELRELNNDFVTLLENTGDFIYFKDKDSRIRFCSQTLANITGHLSWRDMIGKHDQEIFPKDTAQIYYEEELPIFREGKPLLNKTDPYYDAQGRSHWVNSSKLPVFGDDKKTVVGIFGISRDITELMEAQDKLNELNRDLERRVEKELRLNEQGAMALLDLDSKADKLDEKELLQEGLEEAERLTLSQIAYLHFVNEDQQTIELVTWSRRTRKHCEAVFDSHYPIADAGVWADCARTNQPVMHNDYQNLSNMHGYPEGHPHVIRHLSVPVLEGGLVRLIMGVGNKADDYDRSDSRLLQMIANNLWKVVRRRRAEEALKNNSAQLEAANKELESFSYSVSHDLRTPLRAIDGFSRILLDEYTDKLDDEGKRLLNVVRDNTNRMGQLIDDILSFSRTGRLEMNYSEIDMDGLAHAVVEELRSSVAGVNLHVAIEPIPATTGDHSMMHQVFVNLLSNAIKFSRSKDPAIIKVGGAIEGDEAIYYVQDNGVGFDMQYADKLFGVFQRLHSVNEFEGTGIGLAIVKRIIGRQGGRVWAEGKLNEGATIYFALPTKRGILPEAVTSEY